jgi:hypothetical protein
MDSFLPVFEMYSGVKVLRDPALPAMDVNFKQQTDLTRGEIVAGFELYFYVNGYSFQQVSANRYKLVRRAD